MQSYPKSGKWWQTLTKCIKVGTKLGAHVTALSNDLKLPKPESIASQLKYPFSLQSGRMNTVYICI